MMRCNAKLKIVPGDPTTYTWRRRKQGENGRRRLRAARVRVANACGKPALGRGPFASWCEACARERLQKRYDTARARLCDVQTADRYRAECAAATRQMHELDRMVAR